MEQQRLITFGCSYTYGMGLPDCYDLDLKKEGTSPSQLGWAALTAKSLGLKLINKGICGASNLEILFEVLNFEFRPDDIVVIMWTHHVRDLKFNKFKFQNIFKGFKLSNIVKPYRQLSVWQSDNLSRRWQHGVDEYDYSQKSWIYINHADLFFKSKKIKVYHYPAVPEQFLSNPSLIKNLSIDNLHWNGFIVIDKGVDNNHPGVTSNQATSEIITKILKGYHVEHTVSAGLFRETIRI